MTPGVSCMHAVLGGAVDTSVVCRALKLIWLPKKQLMLG